MNFKEIQELIKLINKSNLTEFKMKDGEFELSIRTKKYGKARQATLAQPQIVPVQTTMPAPMPVQQVNVPASSAAPAASAPTTTSEQPAKAESSNYLEVKSPMVGTFYRSSSPDKDPYIKVGDVIAKEQVVCIIEAMKLFNEIESEVSGKVVEILIDDASPVEYDQVLFLVDPNA